MCVKAILYRCSANDSEPIMQPKNLVAELSSMITNPKAGQVALKFFFTLTARWGCSSNQQRALLGFISVTTFYKYRRLPEVRLSRGLLERISHLMGIHRALITIFGINEDRVYGWISSPNTTPPFNGETALQYMLSGQMEGIVDVRRYLEDAR